MYEPTHTTQQELPSSQVTPEAERKEELNQLGVSSIVISGKVDLVDAGGTTFATHLSEDLPDAQKKELIGDTRTYATRLAGAWADSVEQPFNQHNSRPDDALLMKWRDYTRDNDRGENTLVLIGGMSLTGHPNEHGRHPIQKQACMILAPTSSCKEFDVLRGAAHKGGYDTTVDVEVRDAAAKLWGMALPVSHRERRDMQINPPCRVMEIPTAPGELLYAHKKNLLPLGKNSFEADKKRAVQKLEPSEISVGTLTETRAETMAHAISLARCLLLGDDYFDHEYFGELAQGVDELRTYLANSQHLRQTGKVFEELLWESINTLYIETVASGDQQVLIQLQDRLSIPFKDQVDRKNAGSDTGWLIRRQETLPDGLFAQLYKSRIPEQIVIPQEEELFDVENEARAKVGNLANLLESGMVVGAVDQLMTTTMRGHVVDTLKQVADGTIDIEPTVTKADQIALITQCTGCSANCPIKLLFSPEGETTLAGGEVSNGELTTIIIDESRETPRAEGHDIYRMTILKTPTPADPQYADLYIEGKHTQVIDGVPEERINGKISIFQSGNSAFA